MTKIIGSSRNHKEINHEGVKVKIGDLVQVSEYDSITVRGIVTVLSDKEIEVSNATFLAGCYVECDHSIYEDQTVFTFELMNVASIEVATFKKITPLSLINESMEKNYCGSEKIIMSQDMYEKYRRYVSNSEKCYAGIPIEIDASLQGLYVYAVPNEDSIKHLETPKHVYTVEYFLKGMSDKYECVCTQTISAFADQLNDAVAAGITKVKTHLQQFTSVDKMLYRVKLNNNVLERGRA